jgi:hypothetical protein
VRTPDILVIDEFLENPDDVRYIALQQSFVKLHYAGYRTEDQFLHVAPFREQFEQIFDRGLSDWDNSANGRFQCCFASDTIPYHSDYSSRSGVLFLTPNAPIEAGISFYRSRLSGLHRSVNDPDLMELTFGGGAAFDRGRWEEVDRVGNMFNRLVLFDAHLAHGASAYFGSTLNDGRLFQNFFFDLDSQEAQVMLRNPGELQETFDSPASSQAQRGPTASGSQSAAVFHSAAEEVRTNVS